MPSHRTRVRLAPVDPKPRRDTPCVPGLATRLDERRNKRSSRFTPGTSLIWVWSRVETEAGASAAIRSVTVMDVLTGGMGGLSPGGAGDWAIRRTGQHTAVDQAITLGQRIKRMKAVLAPARQRRLAPVYLPLPIRCNRALYRFGNRARFTYQSVANSR